MRQSSARKAINNGRLAWVAVYPRDILSDEKWILASPEVRGAVAQLMLVHAIEGSIPADDESLATLSGLGSRWMECQEKIRAFFVKRSDGRLENSMLAQTLRRARASTEHKSEHATKAARARWDRDKQQRDLDKQQRLDAQGIASEMQKQSSTMPISESESSACSEEHASSESSSDEDDAKGIDGPGSSVSHLIGELERIVGRGPSDAEKRCVADACAGKTRAQLDAAIPRITAQVGAGVVTNAWRYAATVVANQGPVSSPAAAEERTLIQSARQQCRELADIPWDVYGERVTELCQEIDASARRQATMAVWEDYRAQQFKDTHDDWFARFVSHINTGNDKELAVKEAAG